MGLTSSEQFSQRKKDHIDISLKDESQAVSDQFDRIQLQHNPIPEINFDEVMLNCEVFGHQLKSPLFVSSMTLGHEGAAGLNEIIVSQCEKQGWMMGVGSQRRQLFDPEAYKECDALRSAHPDVVLFGNIGLSQIIETPVEKIQSLVDSLGAQFLVVHTNPLQEAIQPEGTPNFRGGLAALETLCSKLSCPVVLKETGCGFSEDSFNRLKTSGLSAIDVSGLGGTHWGRVEGLRLGEADMGYQVAKSLAQWGINTVDSLNNGLKSAYKGPLWASGGVRTGLDAAKLLCLGAEKIGYAKPILQAAVKGETLLEQLMNRLDQELKVAMFCLGVAGVDQMIGKKDFVKWI